MLSKQTLQNYQDYKMEVDSTHHETIISKAYKSFGLLHQTFSETHYSQAKMQLYISIVR